MACLITSSRWGNFLSKYRYSNWIVFNRILPVFSTLQIPPVGGIKSAISIWNYQLFSTLYIFYYSNQCKAGNLMDKLILYALKKLNFYNYNTTLIIKILQFLSGFFINFFTKFWLFNKKEKWVPDLAWPWDVI